MAVYDATRAPRTTGHSGGWFISPLSALVGAVTTWNDTRLTRDALDRLSDHQLRDIGLTRGDIDAVSRRA